MKLSWPHKTRGTFIGQTLHNTWMGVLVYTAVTMVLTACCLSRGTYYRHCPVLISTTVVALDGAEAAEIVAAAAEALTLRVPALTGESPLLLAAALLGLLFPAQSAMA
jgi:hypothetical protein